ncbi:hypothetical protein JB92DRAFT_441203 [Gautieria morchelliformis]|nr:hypothetical protein JB92DRAFT_441203 [Gautieria morchelliformis]
MVDIPGDSNVPYFKLRIDTGSSELWVLGDNYQTIDAKPNLRAGDIPHHASYHPGPTARSHGPSMFQVNHRNCLGAGEYFLVLETARIILFQRVLFMTTFGISPPALVLSWVCG